MRFAKNPHKSLATLQNHLRLAIRHIVQHEHGRILHPRHQLCHFRIENGIPTEAEIHHLAVQPASEDIGKRHPRARNAAALQNRCTVHHYGRSTLDNRLGNELIPRLCSYLQFRNSIIQREIHPELLVPGRHLLHYAARGFMIVQGRTCAPNETPAVVPTGVQVHTPGAHRTHVRHSQALDGFPTDMHRRGIRAELHIEAGSVAAQIPHTIAHQRIDIGRKTGEWRVGVLDSLAVNMHLRGIVPHLPLRG